MSKEVWKPLIYNGEDMSKYYLISSKGSLKGIKTGKIRSLNINHEGYYHVGISLGSRNNKRTIKIHRAVAENFIPNPDNLPVVNHKDGNKLNDNVENLEWVTSSENIQHAYNNNLISTNRRLLCLNNNMIFNSFTEASKWCNLKSAYTFYEYFGNPKRKTAGRHPITNEKLNWILLD